MREFWFNMRFFRYLVVGGINTSMVYAVYAVLLFLGARYAVAMAAALIFGIVVGFKTQGRFVFENRSNKIFYRYVVSWIFLYLVNVGMIALLTTYGIGAYLAGALAIPPMVLLSFAVLRLVVFRHVVSN